jgi:RNA polymerase sigma factor (sigma-70 family)
MTDTPDADLLEQYARENSGAAFTALVERHIGLVHSVAFRHTANPQHAQDITQAVFIILARKAPLHRKTVLPGWLYHTARLTAANFQRAETSRIRREQEAFMQSTIQETAPDALWAELSPLLDEAMSRLGTTDRDALVLRYFQNKSLSEVGASMGLEERTAQKRMTRAIEKLRKFFAQRGVTLTATAIAGAVSANSVQATPVALVKIISAIAVAKGAAATTSTLTLVKGALKIMAWTKMKTTIIAGVGIFLAIGTTAIVVIETEPLSPTKSLPNDAEVRPNLPGVWKLDFASTTVRSGTSTFTVAKNGDFVCKTVFSSDINPVELAGTFQVADGYLVETVTRSTQPNAHIPFVSREQIIQANAKEMIICVDGTNQFVFKKATL